jgi:hypothetical protein
VVVGDVAVGTPEIALLNLADHSLALVHQVHEVPLLLQKLPPQLLVDPPLGRQEVLVVLVQRELIVLLELLGEVLEEVVVGPVCGRVDGGDDCPQQVEVLQLQEDVDGAPLDQSPGLHDEVPHLLQHLAVVFENEQPVEAALQALDADAAHPRHRGRQPLHLVASRQEVLVEPLVRLQQLVLLLPLDRSQLLPAFEEVPVPRPLLQASPTELVGADAGHQQTAISLVYDLPADRAFLQSGRGRALRIVFAN